MHSGFHLNTIALVHGNGGHHPGDLHLDVLAVHNLAGSHQILTQQACALAGVHRHSIYLALDLQNKHTPLLELINPHYALGSSPLLKTACSKTGINSR